MQTYPRLVFHGLRLSSHQLNKFVLLTGSLRGDFWTSIGSGRQYSVAPGKPVITIPVPVEKRALKRHQKIKNISRDADRQRLKNKAVVIACKRQELNHNVGQTYGHFDNVPLASQGWKNRKSYDDHFTINPVMSMKARSFSKKMCESPTFRQLNLDVRLVEALESCGYKNLTNIQFECLPKMLENQDMNNLIAAETGNGKTLCFLVPMIQSLLSLKGDPERSSRLKRPYNSPLGLVVAPSRELAAQIGGVARAICTQLGIKVQVSLGGATQNKVLNSKRGEVDLLIGTLGALTKFFNGGLYSGKYISEIALDEVDTLIDDTFKEGTVNLLQSFGQSTTSLFLGVRVHMTGATFPTSLDNYLSEVLDMEELQKFSTDQIHRVQFHFPQKFIRVAPSRKLENLLDILTKDSSKNKKTLIFSNKASTADFLSMYLNENNFNCVNFNQNVHWSQRHLQYERFSHGEVNILSATDLASRGLDTSMVNHVINFDFPLNPADYIHRAGRVGRVGGEVSCHVTSFVDHPLGVEVLNRIEHAARKNMEIHNVNNNIIRIIQHRQNKKNVTK